MKLKKYGKGGKYAMYQNGGPVKAKKKKKMMGPEKDLLLERMGFYDEPSKEEKAEMAGEKKYLERRAEADRQYRIAIKEGATKEQAEKIAEKYLSKFYLKGGGKMEYGYGGKMKKKKKYLKGGQVKLDVNKDGKISGEDFKMLRAKKK